MLDMTPSLEKRVLDTAELPSFRKFLSDNAVDLEIDLPRYIRTNTHLPPTLQHLKDLFETVPGLDIFFSVQLSAKRMSGMSA